VITNLQYQPLATGKQVHTRPFFGNSAFIVVLFIIFLSFNHSLHAQVRVTGHVFAEIVEPTALSSKANNSHFIEAADHTNNNDLILAEIKLSGGPDMNIDIIVTTSNLVSAKGETLPFDAFACPECTGSNQNERSGDKLFTLKASPVESIRQKNSATYNGSYSVVFMYN